MRVEDLPSEPWVPSANPHAGPRHWSVLPRARVLSARDAVVYASAGDEATFFFLHALEELVGREAVFNVRRRPPHRRIAAAAGTAKREASGAQTKSPAIAVMLPTGPTPLTTAAARADGLGPRR